MQTVQRRLLKWDPKLCLSRRPARGAGGRFHVARLNFKTSRSVFINAYKCFINACRLLPSLLQFGRGRLSLVAISFYVLSLLFGPCRLSEFTLAGPLSQIALFAVKLDNYHYFWLCNTPKPKLLKRKTSLFVLLASL